MPKQSLTEKAYLEIKKRIIRYHLKPGARLRIDELAAALNMSQTPVREALNRLEQEQFVERLPQKGFGVRALSIQEVEDIYDLRAALEVLAAEQAAQRMDPQIHQQLRVLLNKIQVLIKEGERGQILKLSQEFHVIILEGSGNRLLAETGRGILDRIWMIQNLNLLTSDHMTDAQREHLEIMEALVIGDPAKAAKLMRDHLALAKDFLISRLRNRDDFLSTIINGSSFRATE